MNDLVWNRPAFRTALAAVGVLSATLFALALWIDNFVRSAILDHAQNSANRWRGELETAVPNLEQLIQTGQPSLEQAAFIDAVVLGSDVFRFKLFRDDGTVTFVSDFGQFQAEGGLPIDPEAARVARTGASEVTVEDGTAEPFRPDVYVEAYLPVQGPDGTVIGATEVYVDVTGLAQALRRKFNRLSGIVLLGSAIVFLTPLIFLVHRNALLKQRDDDLWKLSRSDALTGVMNRSALSTEMDDLFAQRRRAAAPVGVLFVDVDHFKQVNDTLGHDYGDALLRHIAGLLQSCIRPCDRIARFGGDEFVVVLPGVAERELERMALRILERTGQPFRHAGHMTWPSLSIGAHVSYADESARTALNRADLAVYQAKAEGRGRVVAYSDELERFELRRREVESCIREGLEHDRFYPQFQPIFDASGCLWGFETLLRLRDAQGRAIDPSEFIPVAEQAGLIGELGRWVMRAAVAAAADWPEDICVAVNASAHELRGDGLASQVDAVLQEYGVAPHRLSLELTESVIMDQSDSVRSQLLALKETGVSIALDDFGTGYSSLGYLWRYRFDRLKIDKAFLQGTDFDNARYSGIIETIIVLGHRLNMKVTIEGVETERQFDAMKRLGCDLFQGFHLSRPLDAADAQRFVNRRGAARRAGH